MDNLTEEQIVQIGTGAEAILGSDVYQFLMNYLHTEQMAKIIQSKPHETKTRESAYYAAQALQSFNDSLAQFTQQAKAIAEAQAEADEEADVE
ncbi:hypothetical protein [Pyruvatibacter sp.]